MNGHCGAAIDVVVEETQEYGAREGGGAGCTAGRLERSWSRGRGAGKVKTIAREITTPTQIGRAHV